MSLDGDEVALVLPGTVQPSQTGMPRVAMSSRSSVTAKATSPPRDLPLDVRVPVIFPRVCVAMHLFCA